MERNMISWNFPNWISITLMAAASWAILGLLAQLLKRQQQSGGQVGG